MKPAQRVLLGLTALVLPLAPGQTADANPARAVSKALPRGSAARAATISPLGPPILRSAVDEAVLAGTSAAGSAAGIAHWWNQADLSYGENPLSQAQLQALRDKRWSFDEEDEEPAKPEVSEAAKKERMRAEILEEIAREQEDVEKSRREEKKRSEWQRWMQDIETYYKAPWSDLLIAERILSRDRIVKTLGKAAALEILEDSHGAVALGMTLEFSGHWRDWGLHYGASKLYPLKWAQYVGRQYEDQDEASQKVFSALVLRLKQVLDLHRNGVSLERAVHRGLNPSYQAPVSASQQAIARLFGDSAAGVAPSEVDRARIMEKKLRTQLGASILGPGLNQGTDSAVAQSLSRLVLGVGASLGDSTSWIDARESSVSWMIHAFGLTSEQARRRLRALVECELLSSGLFEEP